MSKNPSHTENTVALKRIEGQIRGIQKMIEEKRYCVDIITQIHSIVGALYKVENEIFRKHVQACVVPTLKASSESEKDQKISEIVELVARFRNTAR